MPPSRLALLTLLAVALTVPGARAQDVGGSCAGGSCAGGCCSNRHCPPPLVHCTERPPKIKFKCACPRPVCDPCQLEHFGYYQTCWCPWPFPPDLRHCPCADEHPALPYLTQPPPPAELPAPRPEMPRTQAPRGSGPELEPCVLRVAPASPTGAPAPRPGRPRVEIPSCDP